MELAQRLLSHVEPEPLTGCWLWSASVDRCGYGRIGVGSRKDGSRTNGLAHVVAFELFSGPVPEGKQLDHLCRVRCCVNPAHLEPVTWQENLRRGISQKELGARVTHCPQGHEYTPENTRLCRKGGGRYTRGCRICGRDACNRWYREHRAKS